MDRATLERKLQLRSWRRGVREMDLLLGRFANACLGELDAVEIRAYEALLDQNDADISDIVFGMAGSETHASIVRRIRAHHGIGGDPGGRSPQVTSRPMAGGDGA